MREKLEAFNLETIKDIAKEKGLKVSGKTKSQIIDMILEVVELEEAEKAKERKEFQKNLSKGENVEFEKRNFDDPEYVEKNLGDTCYGLLEIVDEARCGFIRCENYLPGNNDVYVSNYQIRKYDLRTGDIIRGYKKIQSASEKFPALLKIIDVNDIAIEKLGIRPHFDEKTPIFPDKKFKLLEKGEQGDTAIRVIDLLSPIGMGQRGLIVSPPKAGKTTLLKKVAKSILKYNYDVHMMILLIDERPEEVTDIKEEVVGDNVEVVYSTFDELPDRHRRVSEMVVERAKRLVESGKDVVILLDSITRLTRAYNLVCSPSGRTLTGGLDPAALHMPKKFFGAARNMREGGSLTILSTALIETGSRMDDMIYEEFKGTGNMELVLNRKLQERRVFPAIDIVKSGTRRDDLLLNEKELEAAKVVHKLVNDQNKEDSIEKILDLFAKTKDNDEFAFMLSKIEV